MRSIPKLAQTLLRIRLQRRMENQKPRKDQRALDLIACHLINLIHRDRVKLLHAERKHTTPTTGIPLERLIVPLRHTRQHMLNRLWRAFDCNEPAPEPPIQAVGATPLDTTTRCGDWSWPGAPGRSGPGQTSVVFIAAVEARAAARSPDRDQSAFTSTWFDP